MRREVVALIAGLAAGTMIGVCVARAAENDWRNDVPPALRGFADAIAPAVSPETRTATGDTTCDYGYPYSGSNSYFRRPLATFRHSEPLGALFGYHRADPC